jgi:hypothetical protein
MYVHPVTRANKAMIKNMTITMSPNDIKQANKNHAKKRKIIRQQKDKSKSKNKKNKHDFAM